MFMVDTLCDVMLEDSFPLVDSNGSEIKIRLEDWGDMADPRYEVKISLNGRFVESGFKGCFNQKKARGVYAEMIQKLASNQYILTLEEEYFSINFK
jgi:hypothetical protein